MVLGKFTSYNVHPKFSLNAISVILYIYYYLILMSFCMRFVFRSIIIWDNRIRDQRLLSLLLLVPLLHA